MTDKPIRAGRRRPARAAGKRASSPPQRFKRLPAGSHGLDPQLVREDQARRLRAAMVELIAAKGYPSVRIADLAKLAHVSPPTLYSLYADKEQLLMGAYEDIARRTGRAIAAAHSADDPPGRRLQRAIEAFAVLAATEPQAVSLLVLGAFGAGPQVRRKRRLALDALEAYIHANRAPRQPLDEGDLTVTAIVGGIREVTASRLRHGRHDELPSLAGALASWGGAYPARLPEGLLAHPIPDGRAGGQTAGSSRRPEGPLQAGRSELSRERIVKSQRERIVDATATIVAEKGLSALTIPQIARRASVSNQTFYAMYASKDAAFLGAQKVGMHQALRVAVAAYQDGGEHWPSAVRSGISALLEYLASEPEHAHLTLVDTFAASPEALAIRERAMEGFRAYLAPGVEPALGGDGAGGADPAVVTEAVAGGIWQVLHLYIEKRATASLPQAAPQLTYFALAPVLGAERAAQTALEAS
ncbi:MAG TPA: TetR/AcrR family transcriptional regulator [Solirubrobacteraceae bacterium]